MVASSRSPASCTLITGLRNRDSEMIGRSVSAGKVEMPSTAELHLVHLLRDIDPRFQVDEHRAPAFATGRPHLAHALDGLHGFLDTQEHAPLHLFRRRAAVGHLDLDLVADELGERLLLDLPEQGVGAETDDADHHQVGGDVVLREPADQAVNFVCPRFPGYSACVTHC